MESKVPNDHCHLTIPQLVNAGFRVKDNCFLCKEEGTLCLVAFHPQFPVFQHNQSTTIVMKNYPNPSNVDASSLADRDAIPYIMPPFINYPTYLNNELVGNLANATHTTRIEPSAVLTMSHRSQVSYKKIKSSETCSSRPNLRELINIIVSTANSLSKPYAFRVDEDVFVRYQYPFFSWYNKYLTKCDVLVTGLGDFTFVPRDRSLSRLLALATWHCLPVRQRGKKLPFFLAMPKLFQWLQMLHAIC